MIYWLHCYQSSHPIYYFPIKKNHIFFTGKSRPNIISYWHIRLSNRLVSIPFTVLPLVASSGIDIFDENMNMIEFNGEHVGMLCFAIRISFECFQISSPFFFLGGFYAKYFAAIEAPQGPKDSIRMIPNE